MLEIRDSLGDSILKSDPTVRFSDDPMLKRQDTRNMVATLKKADMQCIRGNVLVDTSIFASHDKAPG